MLALADHRALSHGNFGQMEKGAVEALSMVDNQQIAFKAERPIRGQHHHAVRRGDKGIASAAGGNIKPDPAGLWLRNLDQAVEFIAGEAVVEGHEGHARPRRREEPHRQRRRADVEHGEVRGARGEQFFVVDVSSSADPSNTNAFLTRINLPAAPKDLSLANGLAFVADGSGGLQIVNYIGFDTQGTAPTVAIAVDGVDADPDTDGA